MNKLPEVDQLDLLLYASIAQAKDKDIEAHAAVVPTVVMSERKKDADEEACSSGVE